MPVERVAGGLPRCYPFNIPRRAFVAIVPHAADMPDPLLLLTVVVNKVLVQRQRIADNVPGNLNVKAADLLAAAILHHPPRFSFTLEVVEDIQPRLLLAILGHLRATACQQHRQCQRHHQDTFHFWPPINC